jgi:hypothetical protein
VGEKPRPITHNGLSNRREPLLIRQPGDDSFHPKAAIDLAAAVALGLGYRVDIVK